MNHDLQMEPNGTNISPKIQNLRYLTIPSYHVSQFR
jgi:hypothetical protein